MTDPDLPERAAGPLWWWEPLAESDHVLPPALRRLSPMPDTRFYASDRFGRSAGGLVGLDGVHPTTIGYGVIAQAVLDVLLLKADVRPGAEAPGAIDFAALAALDPLLARPPTRLDEIGRAVGWIGKRVDLAEALRGWRG
ncbi:hypothetical protein QDR37_14455 [Amnibacterium sp. CER49]|uniref:hypothetical protein n=1 Tax=Amnibacterium sp. CER49 TaxID=3039161 RepID=UPI0024496B69|nr:hypothetical protein [Amnibacterium sp. CER49]MDH2445152.1 hypothetical protein [Amnibacterium sp. CER49]